MERPIAQDPMIIASSSRGVMHTANTARRSPKSCTLPRMIWISIGDRPPAVYEPSTPTKRDRCVEPCEVTFAGFQAVSRPNLNGLGKANRAEHWQEAIEAGG